MPGRGVTGANRTTRTVAVIFGGKLMVKKIGIAAGVVLFVCGALICCVVWISWLSMDRFFTEDAVQVIAYEAHRLYRSDAPPTERELQGRIKFLHEASVINLKLTDTGEVVDRFGTPFEVVHRKGREEATTTVTSAGPDTRFGTRDDISYTYTERVEPQTENEELEMTGATAP
jgi:hypothetical protein